MVILAWREVLQRAIAQNQTQIIHWLIVISIHIVGHHHLIFHLQKINVALKVKDTTKNMHLIPSLHLCFLGALLKLTVPVNP